MTRITCVCIDFSYFQERAGRFKRFASLFYKFSPVLMRECPKETVDAWKQMRRFLKPRCLIPALVQCNQPADPTQVFMHAADYILHVLLLHNICTSLRVDCIGLLVFPAI